MQVCGYAGLAGARSSASAQWPQWHDGTTATNDGAAGTVLMTSEHPPLRAYDIYDMDTYLLTKKVPRLLKRERYGYNSYTALII